MIITIFIRQYRTQKGKWQIITVTHIVTLIAFNTIIQGVDYCLRLHQCVHVLEAIHYPKILTNEEQVKLFIIGMRGKYSAYSQHIQNDLIEG